MKLSCLQENLSRGLGIVGRAVASRTTLPITNNVLLSTEKGRLKLAATNLEIAIVHWVGAKGAGAGAITVPARVLSEFVNSLPNDRIDMELITKSKSLQLKCARFEARMSGLDADDFPPIPEINEGVVAQVDPEALRIALSRVVFAAAREDSRPVLTGVHADFKGETLTLAAADGFRLSVDTAALKGEVTEQVAVIIPSRALDEVSRLIADAKDAVTITVNKERGQVLFAVGDVRLSSQLIQGAFPNYSQLIPQQHKTRTTINVEDFLRATRAAAIFARDSSGIVRLQMTPGDGGPAKLQVSARAEEVGDDVGEIDAKVEGDEAKVAFNSKYLIDVLSVLGKGEVTLDTTSPSSPGLLKAVGKGSFMHVVMPMFVQW